MFRTQLWLSSILIAATACGDPNDAGLGPNNDAEGISEEGVVIDPIGDDRYKAFEVSVTFNDTRALPSFFDSPSIVADFSTNNPMSVATHSVKPGETAVLKFAKVPARNAGHYSIEYSSALTARGYSGNHIYKLDNVALASGYVETTLGKAAIVFRRIDVNHMTVTRPNGTTYTAEGEVEIKVYDTDVWGRLDYVGDYTFPTGYGVDVPFGYYYKITINAVTEDGLDTAKFELDFRK